MSRIPLAERLRPTTLDEVIGQDEIIGNGKILTEIIKNQEPVNLIFWGPAGTGKTTLARIIAKELSADFIEISAVAAGKKDILFAIERARENWNLKIRTIVFVDEIHRFNKAQQDAFLPHVESGLITLIGATTENPSFEVIAPLISRSRVIVLSRLKDSAVHQIIRRALQKEYPNLAIDQPCLNALSSIAAGDARFALGALELAISLSRSQNAPLTPEIIQQASGTKVPTYDKNGDQHYNIISAFIKSMRGSDANAALYYLARMLQAGEDPKFIARRMVIFASEDVGLAASGALTLATNAFLAVERIGMPESGIILSHVVTVLSRAKKSRTTYDAWRAAEITAQKSPASPPPPVLCNSTSTLTKQLGYAKDYQWQAGFHAKTSYFPADVGEQDFFHPPSQTA